MDKAWACAMREGACPSPVLTAYQARLSSGELAPDAAQAAAVAALSHLEGELNTLSEPGFSARFLHRKRGAAQGSLPLRPRGAGQIHGDGPVL